MTVDWCSEILRTCPRFTIDFHDDGKEAGAVAAARPHKGQALTERWLTVDEVAILTALRLPRVLPLALRQQAHNCNQILGRLILDGLVEVRRDGRFRSGVSAVETTQDAGREEGSQISELALRYAVAVRHLDPTRLAERLYAFNSLPRTLTRNKDSAGAFAAQTGIDAGAPLPRIGGRQWTVHATPGWVYFRRGRSTESRFKIYLCPHPKDMLRVIPDFAEVLGRASGAVFKIAFPPEHFVRPDKIVAYVPTFEALQQTVSTLASVSLDAAVQSVPFSATVPRAPLLSWGVDPPNLATHKASSWRSWITRQVGVCAHNTPPTDTPEAALNHLKAALRLRDIDPVNWLPSQELLSRRWSLDL